MKKYDNFCAALTNMKEIMCLTPTIKKLLWKL